LRVTVCELSAGDGFERDWSLLAKHVREERSQLVLLPEMPFSRWMFGTPNFDSMIWSQAVLAHDHWIGRLPELGADAVLGTRPTGADRSSRRNEAFVWERTLGHRRAHEKYHLPDETGFWEASWYSRGNGAFDPTRCLDVSIGFQICTDLWFFNHARDYGHAGVQILAAPRCTSASFREQWVLAGRVAAISAGAYCLSSNHAGAANRSSEFGGQGWIIDPDGHVLAMTTPDAPFQTVEIDRDNADAAKATYPRYVN
jgi:N-carbamoylputrescine amidase